MATFLLSRRRAICATACCALLSVRSAFGLGLGDAELASALGQRLQLTVPVAIDPDAEFSQDCVRLVPAAELGEVVPTLNAGKLAFDPVRRVLTIASVEPITEPVLRVVVELGCTQRVRREFVLLLDPPNLAASATGGGVAEASGEPAQAAPALELGMATISAVLGQRLSLAVPVVGADAANLTADCVRLAEPLSSQGAPPVRSAGIRVVEQPSGTRIEVSTPEPVTEPAVRLALDVGCREPLRREFLIMLGLPEQRAASAPAQVLRPAARQERPAHHATARKSAPGADRLVLASSADGAPAAAPVHASISSAPDPELLKRIDAMTQQIEALQQQLNAARQRELKLERLATESGQVWVWLMAALGGSLLAGAFAMTWRSRVRYPPATWEAGAERAPSGIAPASRPAAQAPVVAAEVPEIGGRASMAPAPTTVPPNTAPSAAVARQPQITVTELHDTVQVIKELYESVLGQRSGSSGPETVPGRPQRPLELELDLPASAGRPNALIGSESRAELPVQAAETAAVAARPHGVEQPFTELPTEVGLDLDLSSIIDTAAPGAGAGEAPPAAGAGAPPRQER